MAQQANNNAWLAVVLPAAIGLLAASGVGTGTVPEPQIVTIDAIEVEAGNGETYFVWNGPETATLDPEALGDPNTGDDTYEGSARAAAKLTIVDEPIAFKGGVCQFFM